MKRKALEEIREVSTVEKERQNQPAIDYDPYFTYCMYLHVPDLHVIYELLCNENCNARRPTLKGQRVIKLMKQFKRRLIRINELDKPYSLENFDRRLEVVTPINALPRIVYSGDKIADVSKFPSMPVYKAILKHERAERAKKRK